MQTKDELLQKAEAVTKLKVSAFQCNTCNTLTEYRRTGCKGHNVQRVSATKRWWLCIGCGHHIATVGVRLPTARCPRSDSESWWYMLSGISQHLWLYFWFLLDMQCTERLQAVQDCFWVWPCSTRLRIKFEARDEPGLSKWHVIQQPVQFP